MKSLLFFSFLNLVLLGCSSSPVFQKRTELGDGYSIQDLSKNSHFEVILNISNDLPEKYIYQYGLRAVGEECLSRGFNYFDIGQYSQLKYVAYCYEDNLKNSLGISFQSVKTENQQVDLIVEGLNGKKNTLIEIGDKILSVEGEILTSIPQLKNLIFKLPNKKLKVQVDLSRNGKKMTIDEPLVNLRDSTLGKKDLEDLRLEVK